MKVLCSIEKQTKIPIFDINGFSKVRFDDLSKATKSTAENNGNVSETVVYANLFLG